MSCVAQLQPNSKCLFVYGYSSGSHVREIQDPCHARLLSVKLGCLPQWFKESQRRHERRRILHIVFGCRDHSVSDSLDYVAAYNAAMLPSRDIQEVFSAVVKGRRPPRFSKL